ncbi:trypsin-3-like isoform X2 [Tigriopus californicus]|uniref:trypsin-3-like isoform X2 n=1 Tax=Tigriopus californicus TaxID=6832 RepID=UPI0027DA0F8F|nr:trypsin-3-like isoform X2 [Tigriopus californicus]
MGKRNMFVNCSTMSVGTEGAPSCSRERENDCYDNNGIVGLRIKNDENGFENSHLVNIQWPDPPPIVPRHESELPPKEPRLEWNNGTTSKSPTWIRSGDNSTQKSMDRWYKDGDYWIIDISETNENNINEELEDPHFLDRIVGGTETDPNEFPWMVSLQTTNGQHFCGGSIIHSKYILTAAHCLSWGVTRVRVSFGKHDLTKKETGAFSRNAKELMYHKDYLEHQPDYDIGMIKLRKPIPFTESVNRIRIPNPNIPSLQGYRAMAAGWGNVAYTSLEGSSVLRKVTIQVFSNDYCQKKYFMDNITERMICAGSRKGGKDSCQGDSGGPLAMKGKNYGYVQVGIVAWGRGCGSKQYPGVYTRVSKFTDWIRKKADLS